MNGSMVKTCPCLPYSDAFDFQFGVVIFRLRAGFDATEEIDEGRGMKPPHHCIIPEQR